MRPDTAMVLAAGLGTRMRPLTDSRPKPLLPVGGRPLIDHALDIVEGAGLARAVVNLHYLGEMIGAHLEGRKHPEILFSPEEPEILETGGGIAQALPLLGPKPFLTLNSDAIFAGPNPLTLLREAWPLADAHALLLLVPREHARGYTRPGDFFLDVARPRRREDAAEAPYVYSGAQVIAPEAFEDVPQGPFSLNLVWDRLLARRRLKAILYPGLWVDVGTPAGLQEAERVFLEAAAGPAA